MTTPLISLAYLTKYDSFWHEYASDFWLYLWIHRVQEGNSSFVSTSTTNQEKFLSRNSFRMRSSLKEQVYFYFTVRFVFFFFTSFYKLLPLWSGRWDHFWIAGNNSCNCKICSNNGWKIGAGRKDFTCDWVLPMKDEFNVLLMLTNRWPRKW